MGNVPSPHVQLGASPTSSAWDQMGRSSTGQVLWQTASGWGSRHGWQGVPMQQHSGDCRVVSSPAQKARHAGSWLPALAGASDSPASTPRSDGS